MSVDGLLIQMGDDGMDGCCCDGNCYRWTKSQEGLSDSTEGRCLLPMPRPPFFSLPAHPPSKIPIVISCLIPPVLGASVTPLTPSCHHHPRAFDVRVLVAPATGQLLPSSAPSATQQPTHVQWRSYLLRQLQLPSHTSPK